MPPKKRKAAGDDDGAGAGAGGKPFAGLTFCLTGTLSKKKADVEKMIKAAGGKIAGSVTSAVTHVVAEALGTGKVHVFSRGNLPYSLKQANEGLERGLAVVKESFLDASIASGSLVTDKQHFWGGGDDGEGGEGDEQGTNTRIMLFSCLVLGFAVFCAMCGCCCMRFTVPVHSGCLCLSVHCHVSDAVHSVCFDAGCLSARGYCTA